MTNPIKKILSDFTPEGSSDFCSKVVTNFAHFEINIKDVGDLRLPLKPRKIKTLIKQARPAKYGLKEKTLLDKSVRDVWEIPKSRVKINQRHWKKSFDTALLQLKTSLGLSEQSKLKAELHNLIIYEPGQFFKPHQDSEKSDGMVATLIVLLPSYYRGGTLIVDHQGDRKRFTSRSTPEDKLTFIAFYADCHHEVLPVTDGYRVALTYNLILKSGKDSAQSSDAELQQSLSLALSDYFEKEQSKEPEYLRKNNKCKKFAYLLDHEYTQKGLDWSHLKNSDRTRVNALREIAKARDMNIYLSLVDIHESWECLDDTDWDYHRHRYWQYDEEVETEDEPEDEYSLGELLFSEYEFLHCINIDGKKVDMSDLVIRETETFHTRKMDEFTPFESEYEGYMGNWGNTMDRWYHRAAVILWRKTDHYLMLLERSPIEFLKAVTALAKKKTEREKVQRIVAQVLPGWCDLRNDENTQSLSHVLQLALVIGNPENATQLVAVLSNKTLCKATTPILIELTDAYGTDWCIKNMHTWLSSKYGKTISLEIVETLLPIIKILVKNASKNSLALTHWLLHHQFDALVQSFCDDAKMNQQAELDENSVSRIKTLTDLMLASIVAEAFSVYDQLVSYTINNKNLFPIVELSSLLLKTHRCQTQPLASPHYAKLKEYVLANIEIALKCKPRNANDWSINDKNKCNCDDCKVFNEFLQDTSKQKMIWPMGKQRRQHIHQVVERMKLPIAHTTERTGSPHKLRLTKTTQIFKRETALRAKYEKALGLLEGSEN